MNQVPGKPSYWRSALFSLGMIATTCLWAPLVVMTFPLPYPKRYDFAVVWCRMILFWLKFTCKLDYRITGLENVPNQPVVILSKHQSTWETLTLARLFSPQVWVLKRELLFIPFFGWGLAMLQPIAIDRQARRAAMKQVITQGTSRLNAGCNVVVFPEGTRVQVGKRKRYGLGGILLAQKAGYPVIPVAHNAGQFWPRLAFLKHPGTIQLVIGKPLDSKQYSPEELKDKVETWIEDQVQQMTGIKAQPL